MKTTETFMSPSPPCLLLNHVRTAALSPHPLRYEQVKTRTTLPCRVPSLHLSNHTSSFVFSGHGECLEHGYVLNSRYQVVYPFPTFQPAFQLKKDQVILLNTSYSLVACGISLCPGKVHVQQSRTRNSVAASWQHLLHLVCSLQYYRITNYIY